MYVGVIFASGSVLYVISAPLQCDYVVDDIDIVANEAFLERLVATSMLST